MNKILQPKINLMKSEDTLMLCFYHPGSYFRKWSQDVNIKYHSCPHCADLRRAIACNLELEDVYKV